jgi:hypothetical protein
MLDRTAVFSALAIVGDHLTNLLRTVPRDIAFVASGPQRQPVFARFALRSLPRGRATIERCRAGLAVGISATIGRVGENAIDRGITRPFPNDIAIRLPGRQL